MLDSRPLPQRYGFAVLVTVLAVIIRVPLASLLGADVPFILFFPTVTLCAWFGGFGPGLLATGLSAVAALFLYLEPLMSLALTNYRDAARLFIFISGSSFISWICGSLRASIRAREAALAAEQGAYLRADEQQQQLTSMLESMTDGFVALDREWRYTFINRRAEQLINRTQAEALGKQVWELFPAVKHTRFYTEAQRAIAEQVTVSYEEFIPATGRWFAVRVYPSPDGGHSAYLRDVTKRKQAEARLHANERRLNLIYQSVNDSLFLLDVEPEDVYRFLSINKAFLSVTGLQEEQVVGKRVEEVLPESSHALVISKYQEALRDNKTVKWEEAAFFPAGQRVGEVFVTPMKDDLDGRVLLLGGVHDITERQLAAEAQALLATNVESQRKHLQEMVANVPGVVWEAWGEPDAAHQRIDFVNDYVETLLGYTVEEWLATPNFWLTIVHPEDRENAVRAATQTFYSGGTTGTNQFRWLTKDNKAVWVETQSIAISDESGKPIGMRGVTMDITVRKQKEANEHFLAEASTALASSLDYESTLATVARLAVPHFADWCAVDMADENDRLNRLAVAHIDPAKVAQAHELSERYPPNPDDSQGLYEVLRTGQAEFYPDITDELIVQSARDEEHLALMRQIGFCSAMIVPLKTRDQILGVITFVNSDSGRHHTVEDLALAEDLASRAALAVDNARLYQAEQQTRQIAERTSDYLSRLQTVSTALSQALTPSQVADAVLEQGLKSLGAHAGMIVVLDERQAELEIIATTGFPSEIVEQFRRFSVSDNVPVANAVRTRSPVLLESFTEWFDHYPMLRSLSLTTKSHALSAYPLIIEGRTVGAQGFSFAEPRQFSEDDCTFMLALAQQCAQSLDRARQYETEQRLRAEAETANRLKDEFLATVSHELRTPLTSILGWSRMLKGGRLDADTAKRAVESIERNAAAQNQLIEDLLDVSRIITGKLRLEVRPVELSPVIVAAIDAVSFAAASKEIRLQPVLNPGAGPVLGDPERLQQVVWNLISNAVKFTPKGGRVQVVLQRNNSSVEVIVSDTGAGIEPEFLPYVFERFRQADGTTKRSHGGLGLGLAIVRHLVELHGGTVRADSAGEGMGASFTVALPLMASREHPVVERRMRPMSGDRLGHVSFDCSAHLTGLKVLVVDDEPDTRELLVSMLNGCGAEVIAVKSVAEALGALQETKPDVVLSDIGMPDQDGYDLIRQLRASEAGRAAMIPAIALTAYAKVEDRIRALSAGFQAHVAKPVEPMELAALISSLAGGKDKEPTQ